MTIETSSTTRRAAPYCLVRFSMRDHAVRPIHASRPVRRAARRPRTPAPRSGSPRAAPGRSRSARCPGTRRSRGPPPPIRAATVTMPMFCTSTMRMPVTMTGSASGSSMRDSTCPLVMPMPRAASTAARDTRLRPATVFATMGSSEYRNSATAAGRRTDAADAEPLGQRHCGGQRAQRRHEDAEQRDRRDRLDRRSACPGCRRAAAARGGRGSRVGRRHHHRRAEGAQRKTARAGAPRARSDRRSPRTRA